LLKTTLAVVAGCLVFAMPAALLFALSGEDPHVTPTIGFAIVSTLYGMAFAFLAGL